MDNTPTLSIVIDSNVVDHGHQVALEMARIQGLMEIALAEWGVVAEIETTASPYHATVDGVCLDMSRVRSMVKVVI